MVGSVKLNRKWLCAIFIALPWMWPLSLGPYAEAIPWLVCLGASAFVLLFWPSSDSSRMLALVWSATAVICVIPGLIQYFGFANLDIFWPWIREAPPGYASGNIGQPNQQATLLAIGLFALACLLRTRSQLLLISCAGAFVAVGLAATASRIGALHLVLMFLIFWCWGFLKDKRLVFWYGLVIFVYCAFTLMLPYLGEELGIQGARSLWVRIQTAESSCGSRRLLWSNVWELIQAKPWLGWGWGNLRYAQYVTLFEGPRWCSVLGNAHNLPLHLMLTLGIPAGLFICLLVIFIITKGKPWSESNVDRQLAWGGVSLIAAHSMVEFPLWYGPFQVVFFCCLHILISHSVVFFQGRGLSDVMWRGFVPVLMLGFSVFGLIDYWRVSQPYFPPNFRVDVLRDEKDPQKIMDYAAKSVFYQDQALFARLTVLQPNSENAIVVNRLANYLLHFSPEPRVLVKVLDSALILGDEAQLSFHMIRFKAAYPREYEAWKKERFNN